MLHMVCDLTIAADNAVFGQTGPKVYYILKSCRIEHSYYMFRTLGFMNDLIICRLAASMPVMVLPLWNVW